MKSVFRTAAVLAAVTSIQAGAADLQQKEVPDMVVTATGVESPVANLAHSITVISADDIERHGWRTLPQALKHVPGMHIVQSGAPGSVASIFIRGTRSQHVLVMIDGVRINDPSLATRSANIAGIDLAGVERIEIVRGPQSGLYGSDAFSGVVNIITGGGSRPSYLSAEAGSYDTYRVAGALNVRTGAVDFASSASYIDSKGFSSASDKYEGNHEDDGFSTLNLAAKVGVKVSDSVFADMSVRYVDSENEYDLGAGPNADSDENKFDGESFSVHGGLRYAAAESIWSSKLTADYITFDREYNSTWGRDTFDGDNVESEWRNDFAVSDAHLVSVGFVYSDESAKGSAFGKETADTASAYIQDEVTYGDLNAVASVRYDDHDRFGSEVTYRLAPSYAVSSGTRLKASVGTAFKAPSLYQLYAPAGMWGPVGNSDLDAEEMFAWDAGVEQVIVADLLSVDLVWFRNDIDNMIEFANGYENVAEAETEGVEFSVTLTPVESLVLNASYTYTDATDKSDSKQLIRIPKNRASLDVSYAATERLNVNASVLYVDSRNDSYYDPGMFMSVDVKTDSYVTLDLSADFALTETVSVFGRIENLTDEDYEEIYGYGTPGRSAYGGAKVMF
jgi:vitamin B12 transporter